MKKNKNNLKIKLTTFFTIAILMTTVSILVISVNAQDLPEEIIIGPAPAGVTEDMKVPTELVLMVRPNPIGQNQIFLVNIWTGTSPRC